LVSRTELTTLHFVAFAFFLECGGSTPLFVRRLFQAHSIGTAQFLSRRRNWRQHGFPQQKKRSTAGHLEHRFPECGGRASPRQRGGISGTPSGTSSRQTSGRLVAEGNAMFSPFGERVGTATFNSR
jgi:hypothetical protein